MAGLDRETLWAAVETLSDRLLEGDLDDERRVSELRDHRMNLLVAARSRARGEAPPAALRSDERTAALGALATPLVAAKARAAFDGPMILMKGPEVAGEYPDPLDRPCLDLDLLVLDAEGAQRALLAAGFRAVGRPWNDGPDHQLPPLYWPGLPLAVEIHRHPHWVAGLRPPAGAELFEAARPSGLGIPGLLAPALEHHAVLLAVHAWAHRPLGRLGQLIDVEAMSLRAASPTLDALAGRWGCGRLWRITRRAAEAVLLGKRAHLPLKIWARHLHDGRDRTVLGAHLQRWFAPACGLPGHRAITGLIAAVASDLRPQRGEDWTAQAIRMRSALAHTAVAESEHLAGVPPAGCIASPRKRGSR